MAEISAIEEVEMLLRQGVKKQDLLALLSIKKKRLPPEKYKEFENAVKKLTGWKK